MSETLIEFCICAAITTWAMWDNPNQDASEFFSVFACAFSGVIIGHCIFQPDKLRKYK